MSGLVTMIVLAYLLVIAVAVALWSAVSMRRISGAPTEDRERSSASRGARRERSARSSGHDAYRGVRAQQRSAEAAFADPYRADERDEPRGPDVGVTGKAATGPRAPESTPREVRTDGIRVLDSRRERERKAEARAAEKAAKDDAFDRFLRANEELDR